MQMPLRHLLL